MRHRDMRDQSSAEERALALVRAIDELVDQYEGAGRQLLLERAAGRQRDEIGHARALEHVDIGPVIDVGGRKPMALVVTRQEDHRQARDLADAQRGGRLAPRALDLLGPHVLEAGQIVDAGAADDAEHGPGHGNSPRMTTNEGPRFGALCQSAADRMRVTSRSRAGPGRARARAAPRPRATPSSW